MRHAARGLGNGKAICLIGHEFYGNVRSGNGSFAIALAEGLLGEGYGITFITPCAEGLKRHEMSGRLEIIRVPVPGSSFLDRMIPNVLDNRWMFALKMKVFARRLELSPFSLVHVLDVNDSHFVDDRIKKTGIPLVVSVNDYYCFEGGSVFNFPYKTGHVLMRAIHYRAQYLLNRAALRRFDFIVSNTRYLKNKLLEHYRLPEYRVSVIHRGKDVDRYLAAEGKYLSARVLFIGSNMERKGVLDLILASRKVVARKTGVKFVIVGKIGVKLGTQISRLIERDGLKDNFIFHDYLAPEEVRRELSVASVFVLPAHIENLAQSILEAMASKTPVVVTDVGGNSEAVNGQCGVLVKKNDIEAISDAVLRIIDAPGLAKEMGEAGYRNIVENFSVKKMIGHYVSLYERAFAGRDRSAC
ncbi:MAG TPA: hypothetical protein DDW94_10615 [Deltaproteobacteria bacterium]|nr:MAG: hypothetical protein A2Z79_11760 [Deltaproteobacteria bacterium GWA2_55_82]OGQ63543.1 MAG: hypothetical protein A3I81_05950 [Deltaproteobacteria bacterium RIFCSPLOWO2_02_FULL_55_12]OIJ74924.1 MAG: hypothetical protein A2V21_312005 [Deltaproteobacteria bacterium GWC2_55_46]HBG47421.1 hypothetical protein [Deltaproteobacteria bacterium]HCY11437.1 hypothetical protein [Deltaproteobacteria bacterium]